MILNKPNTSEFFLGCSTPQGFIGRLEQLTSPQKLDTLYLLKGGAGSGKSTLLKKIAKKALELGEDIEIIRCSSDFESLDGVVLPKRRTAVFDATLPHARVTKIKNSSEASLFFRHSPQIPLYAGPYNKSVLQSTDFAL